MKHVLTLVLIAFVILGCGKKTETINKETKDAKQEVKAQDSLSFEMKNFKKTYKDCNDKDEKCSYLKISYPVFGGRTGTDINKVIDAYLIDSIFSIDGKGSNVNLSGVATAFFGDYESFSKDASPDFPVVYALDVNTSILYNKPAAISVSIDYYINTGGVHPNSFARYFVFNPKTGKHLKLGDIFISGFDDKLNKLIDKKYRADKNLKDTDRLDGEKGFLFENFIKFNDNFLLTKEGINFFYNNYEIAPYAVGPTELKFTYKELEEILRPEYKL